MEMNSNEEVLYKHVENNDLQNVCDLLRLGMYN